MNRLGEKCTHNVAETCVYSLSLDQLFELTGGDKQAFLDAFAARRLTYGDIEGRPDLLSGILSVQVRNEEKIPNRTGSIASHSRIFCTRHSTR